MGLRKSEKVKFLSKWRFFHDNWRYTQVWRVNMPYKVNHSDDRPTSTHLITVSHWILCAQVKSSFRCVPNSQYLLASWFFLHIWMRCSRCQCSCWALVSTGFVCSAMFGMCSPGNGRVYVLSLCPCPRAWVVQYCCAVWWSVLQFRSSLPSVFSSTGTCLWYLWNLGRISATGLWKS